MAMFTKLHFVAKRLAAVTLFVTTVAFQASSQQGQKIAWSEQEKPIRQELQGLRDLSEKARVKKVKDLAGAIRQLPASPNKLRLAAGLANLATEGDTGTDALQEVATTLATALREDPPPEQNGKPAYAYVELARLVKYKHAQADLTSQEFKQVMAQLQADDEAREEANFTLGDLKGKRWTLQDLRGKVVLVNFWATWCPPCRKEMPELDSLYDHFRKQGLVVLAISDEPPAKIMPYLAQHSVSFPILVDTERKVIEQYHVDGIPKSFVYDRNGKMVAQAIDMSTRKQFAEMLAQAGLR